MSLFLHIYVCIKFCFTNRRIYRVSFARKYINFIYLPIEVNMNQLKVDAKTVFSSSALNVINYSFRDSPYI